MRYRLSVKRGKKWETLALLATLSDAVRSYFGCNNRNAKLEDKEKGIVLAERSGEKEWQNDDVLLIRSQQQ